MKTYLLSILATTVAALMFTTAAHAQYRTVSDDGIAASPRMRQMLNERKAAAPVSQPAMACDKCVDTPSAKLPLQPKGAEVMTGTRQISYTHGCPSCDTKLTVAGEGKAKRQVSTHTCSMSANSTVSCCASK